MTTDKTSAATLEDFIKSKKSSKNRGSHISVKGDAIYDYNFSAFYLLPLTGVDIIDFDGSLFNTYIDYSEKEDAYSIFVVLKSIPKNIDFLISISKPKSISYNINSTKYTLICYDLTEYRQNVEHFLNGDVCKYPKKDINRCLAANGITYTDTKDNMITPFLTRPESLQFEIIGSFYTKYTYTTNVDFSSKDITTLEKIQSITKNINALYAKRSEQIGEELPEEMSLMDKGKIRYKKKLKGGGFKYAEDSFVYFVNNILSLV